MPICIQICICTCIYLKGNKYRFVDFVNGIVKMILCLIKIQNFFLSLIYVVHKTFLKANKLVFALVNLVLLLLPPEQFTSINSCHTYVSK